MIVLITNIPCINCATAIKNTLKSIPNIKNVECSVEKSQICIEAFEGEDENKLKLIIVEELKNSGRICN